MQKIQLTTHATEVVMEGDSQSRTMQESQASPSESDHPYYGHYDLIMCIEDKEKPPTEISSFTKIVFFTGCALFSIFTGLGMSMVTSRTRYRDEMDEAMDERRKKNHSGNSRGRVVHEDPVIFATRALGWGSLIGLLGAGAVGLMVHGL